MYRIAVVDDDLAARNEIRSFIERYTLEHKLEIKTTTFSDGEELLHQPPDNFDIVFLDIEMQHTDGLETARLIRLTDALTVIIFITGFIQYSIQGYSVSAMSFLVKPIGFENFSNELGRAIIRVDKQKPSYMCIRTDNGVVQLLIDNITYIETIGRKICIHTLQDKHDCWETMTALEEKLSGKGFFRSHKAYLINLAHLQKVLESSAIVANIEVLVSRKKRRELVRSLIHFASERV